MLKRTVALGCAALLFAATGGWAQNVGEGLQPEPDQSTTRVGSRGANFLEIPVGARAQSLGASGAALVNGVESLAWNVASAASLEEFSVGWSYSELFGEADITHQFAGVVLPITASSAIGLSLVSLSSGDMVRTTEVFPEGGDPVFGNEFNWSAFALTGSYSRAITDRLNVGAGVKFISEGIDEAKAEWIGLDLGALFRTGLLGTTLGASIQNLGGESKFEGRGIERNISAAADAFGTEEDVPVRFNTTDLTLPTAFRFSLLTDVTGTPEALVQEAPVGHNVRVLIDVYDSIDTALEPSLGIEYDFRGIVFGRVGKRWFNEARTDDFREFTDGLAFGGGLRIPLLDRSLGFDYAYTDMGLLENVQTISLSFGS